MKKRKIPKFKADEDIAKFWDTHDLTDYWNELEIAKDVVFEKPKKETVSIRLDQDQIKLLKKLAHRLGLGYTSLIRSLVIEKLSRFQSAH